MPNGYETWSLKTEQGAMLEVTIDEANQTDVSNAAEWQKNDFELREKMGVKEIGAMVR
jgi:hypothetical protein